jgi:hypothetical protein
VNAYQARSHADLISIAQIIACGLASLGSLSLSMADNLSLSMTLRLRSNAVALNRAAEQTRRALKESRLEPQPDAQPPFDDDFDEATVIAAVAATQQRAEQTEARMHPKAPLEDPAEAPVEVPVSTPAPAPISTPACAATEPTPSERQRQAMWGAAAARIAGEFTASLPHLPPAERRMATLRAAVLNNCANDLLSGNGAPRITPAQLAASLPDPRREAHPPVTRPA